MTVRGNTNPDPWLQMDTLVDTFFRIVPGPDQQQLMSAVDTPSWESLAAQFASAEPAISTCDHCRLPIVLSPKLRHFQTL